MIRLEPGRALVHHPDTHGGHWHEVAITPSDKATTERRWAA